MHNYSKCSITILGSFKKDNSVSHFQEALQSLATDPGLYQMLPRFCTFISEGVRELLFLDLKPPPTHLSHGSGALNITGKHIFLVAFVSIVSQKKTFHWYLFL